jgi:hypothetical protein
MPQAARAALTFAAALLLAMVSCYPRSPTFYPA